MKIFGIISIGFLVAAFSVLGLGIWFGFMLNQDEKEIDNNKLGRNYNALMFDEEQIEEIKANHFILDSLFRLISKTSGIPISHTGYVAYDTLFYHKYCSDSLGNYLSASDCRLQILLDDAIVRHVDVAIRSLIRLGFKSCQYESTVDEFTLLADREFLDSRDYRIVLVKEDIDSIFLSKTYLKLIEYKKGLALVKQE